MPDFPLDGEPPEAAQSVNTSHCFNSQFDEGHRLWGLRAGGLRRGAKQQRDEEGKGRVKAIPWFVFSTLRRFIINLFPLDDYWRPREPGRSHPSSGHDLTFYNGRFITSRFVEKAAGDSPALESPPIGSMTHGKATRI
jgi:hypothetical protein